VSTDEWLADEADAARDTDGLGLPHTPSRRYRGAGAGVLDRVSVGLQSVGQRVKRTDARARLIVAAGLAAVVTLAAVAAFTGWFSGSADPPATPPTTAAASPTPGPGFAVQQFTFDRGITINVPKDWTRSDTSSYVDFTDPTGKRKIRINVENASGTAQKFLQQAESALKGRSTCASPYQRVNLREVQTAGQAGAELEYTCGRNDDMRHGLWRAVVREGKAYHFYLTVPDELFTENRAIYDEMVRSFTLA